MIYSLLFRSARRVARHLLRRAGYDVPPVRQLRPRHLARGLLLGRRSVLRRRAARALWRASRRRRWH
ncbi:MAG: hypothetical protein ACRDYZ_05855 [Acidimicrobiales bacterium]